MASTSNEKTVDFINQINDEKTGSKYAAVLSSVLETPVEYEDVTIISSKEQPELNYLESKLDPKVMEEKYGLNDIKNILNSRETENFVYLDNAERTMPSGEALLQGMSYLKTQGPSYIKVKELLSEEAGISHSISPSGELLYIDKARLALYEDSEDGRLISSPLAEGGKCNLLLNWGFNADYFLTNRESGWGSEKCPYMVSVSNDDASIISELRSKGCFSSNYREAYNQITSLLNNGGNVEINPGEVIFGHIYKDGDMYEVMNWDHTIKLIETEHRDLAILFAKNQLGFNGEEGDIQMTSPLQISDRTN